MSTFRQSTPEIQGVSHLERVPLRCGATIYESSLHFNRQHYTSLSDRKLAQDMEAQYAILSLSQYPRAYDMEERR